MELFTRILPSLPSHLLIALSASGVIFGDYSAKTWSVGRSPMWLAFAFLGYLISAFFFIPSLLKEGLVVNSILWELFSISGFLIIGLLIFKEQLTTAQMVGAAFGVLALITLSLGD